MVYGLIDRMYFVLHLKNKYLQYWEENVCIIRVWGQFGSIRAEPCKKGHQMIVISPAENILEIFFSENTRVY